MMRFTPYLDDYGLLYQNVEAIPTIQTEAPILDRQSNLLLCSTHDVVSAAEG